jgi:uroporphyrinogen decarboxylase
MHTDPVLWHDIMQRLVQHSSTFISAQLAAGARAFQLFDSWAGSLSPTDYREFVLPHSREVFAHIAAAHPGAPGIHFGIGCDHLLEVMFEAMTFETTTQSGPRVIGLDWRTSIRSARRRLGSDLVVQGNLDPALVLAGREPALAGAERVLADNDGHAGHIFNLGHGVDPASDPGVLADIVSFVHERTRTDNG